MSESDHDGGGRDDAAGGQGSAVSLDDDTDSEAGVDGTTGDGVRTPFALETEAGETVYADPLDGDGGTEGTFLVVYRSADRQRRYGWYCAACEGLDVAMDTMGRVECNRCGNLRKATEWDAAHE